MFVKPAPGRIVRYPGDPARLLPESGVDVPERDIFWRRRLQQGDVVLVTTGTAEVAPSGQTTTVVNDIRTDDAPESSPETAEDTGKEDEA